ncbi:MAG: hydrogenase maturation nickel metallochaperone HypA [Candidatus Bathyarchaeota archaeon]
MHEFSMTSQIVNSVLEEAKKRGAKKVLEVHLIIGKFTLLVVEQIRFSYRMLVEGTIMEGSKLFIQRQKGKVKCDGCGYEGAVNIKDDPIYHLSFPSLICPKCGSSTRIVEGRECLVKSAKLVI